MELVTPRCGDYEVHGEHGVWRHGYTVWVECPGWAQEQADVKVLYEKVRKFQADHMLPRKMPAGIRMEMHPAVRYALFRNTTPGYREFVDNEFAKGGECWFQDIPAVVTLGVESGAWCLRSDGGVIAEGVIRAARLASR